MKDVANFVKIDSAHGAFIVNRHCSFQAESLIKTGLTHIEAELNNIFVFIDKLPDGSVVIDGGTNIGFFTIPVAMRAKGRGFQFLGFEPQKMIFYAHAGALALNDLDNVFLYNLGLSDVSGQAVVPEVNYGAEYDFGTIAIADKFGDKSAQQIKNYLDDKTINTISIDEMSLPRVDFIKLDVEGHEPQAIKGALETIKRCRPILWIEYFLVGEETIKSSLSSVTDYTFQVIDYQNMVCAPTEKLQAMEIGFAN